MPLEGICKVLSPVTIVLSHPSDADPAIVTFLAYKKYNFYIKNIFLKANFVAPNSVVVGDVKIGDDSSLWYGATLRGDNGQIIIGNSSVIHDLTSVVPKKGNTTVGDHVYVGPNSYLESCNL